MNQAGGYLDAEAFVGQLGQQAPAGQPRNTTSWVSSQEAPSFAQGVSTRMASLRLGKQAHSCLSKLGLALAWRLLFTGERVKLLLGSHKGAMPKLAAPRLPPGRPNIAARKPLCLSLSRAQRVLAQFALRAS